MRSGDPPLRKSDYISINLPSRATYFVSVSAAPLSVCAAFPSPSSPLPGSEMERGTSGPGGGRWETRRSAPARSLRTGSAQRRSGLYHDRAPSTEPDISPLCGSEMKYSSRLSSHKLKSIPAMVRPEERGREAVL